VHPTGALPAALPFPSVYTDDETSETGCLKPVAILLAVLVAFVVIGSIVMIEHDNQINDTCSAAGCESP
jgi:hypothetical protein